MLSALLWGHIFSNKKEFKNEQDWPVPECNGTRPLPEHRRFASDVVDNLIEEYKARGFLDAKVGKIFENALPNCLDTTIFHQNGADDTFIITGDIEAMWLRDSYNQIKPYISLATSEPPLKDLICGTIRRQAKQVLTSRHANAFSYGPVDQPQHGNDTVVTKPPISDADKAIVFESKYELNSLISVLGLSTEYYEATGDGECFHSNSNWVMAIEAILDTIKSQQSSTMDEYEDPSYYFSRLTSNATDTTYNKGMSAPVSKCGLSKSYFRASDDAVTFGFNVPDNAQAVVQLNKLHTMLKKLGIDNTQHLAGAAKDLANEIDQALKQHAIKRDDITNSSYYFYEVDGYGNGYFMDDANIPSLLSLPYLGYVDKNDPVYLETRKRILSEKTNPYYFAGIAGKGVGGPHEGPAQIWPMAIIVQAITSDDDVEIKDCLQMLATTTADTYFMHETFNMNDETQFTRRWFSWANSLFGELIIKLASERPHLIFQS